MEEGFERRNKRIRDSTRENKNIIKNQLCIKIFCLIEELRVDKPNT